MLGGDRRRIELAYSLMFTLPGTPVLRYGDELGMGDNLALPERTSCRTPMQWSREPHGGFTKNKKPVVPVIDDGPYSYQHVNAADQRRDPNSLLNWTERIIRMRKEVPEFGWGDFKVLNLGDKSVFTVRYDWRNNSVLTLHNLASEPREVEFATGLGEDDGDRLISLLLGSQQQAAERQTPGLSGGVWLPLVPRWRARLPAETSGILRTSGYGDSLDTAKIIPSLARSRALLITPVRSINVDSNAVAPLTSGTSIGVSSSPKLSAITSFSPPQYRSKQRTSFSTASSRMAPALNAGWCRRSSIKR